jgi:hypothetical protein
MKNAMSSQENLKTPDSTQKDSNQKSFDSGKVVRHKDEEHRGINPDQRGPAQPRLEE